MSKSRQPYSGPPPPLGSCEESGWKALKQRLDFKAKTKQDISSVGYFRIFMVLCLQDATPQHLFVLMHGNSCWLNSWITSYFGIICLLLLSNFYMSIQMICLYFTFGQNKPDIFTFLFNFTKYDDIASFSSLTATTSSSKNNSGMTVIRILTTNRKQARLSPEICSSFWNKTFSFHFHFYETRKRRLLAALKSPYDEEEIYQVTPRCW